METRRRIVFSSFLKMNVFLVTTDITKVKFFSVIMWGKEKISNKANKVFTNNDNVCFQELPTSLKRIL